jgi:hypothetical protein
MSTLDATGTSATTTTTTSSSSSRALAKKHILNTWKQRRAERLLTVAVNESDESPHRSRSLLLLSHPSQSSLDDSSNNNNNNNNRPYLSPPILNICSLVQKSWQQLMGRGTTTSLDHDHHNHHNRPSCSSKPKRNNHSNKKQHSASSGVFSSASTFPSVLQMNQAHALMQQVERMRAMDTNTTNNDHTDNADDKDNDATVSSSSSSSSLSILPSGYNYQRAILQLSQSRSRAFFLLDLSQIVQRLVEWNKQQQQRYFNVVGTLQQQQQQQRRRRTSSKLRFLHSIQANGDEKLLQVLIECHVGLVVTTQLDMERVMAAMTMRNTRNTTTTTTAQPRVYLGTTSIMGSDACLRDLVWKIHVHAVVVDGPDEVVRILTSLQRMALRKRVVQVPIVRVMLRVHDNETTTWQSTLQATMQQIQSNASHAIWEGISLEIGPESEWTRRQELAEQLLCTLVDAHPDLQFRIDVTGFESDPFPSEWVTWWQRMEKHTFIKEITVDASLALIAPAGALCTRIIGVRETKMEDAVTTVETDNVDASSRRHYYIDDGCYGSLYQRAYNNKSESSQQKSADFTPMPLQGASSQAEPCNRNFLSTVWGPTCDGLDRVCRDIVLPYLQRDDWLVFPNLGCSSSQGLGTAFNGFAPPDTAYCVLGYFQK